MKKPALDGRFGWALNFAVVIATLATIPVIVLLDQGEQNPWLYKADWAIWAVFLLEYVIEITLSPSRSAYLRRNWLSPLVLVLSFPLLPDLLGAVRLARLVRLLRFTRLAGVTMRGLDELRAVLARRGLLLVAVTTALLILAGAAALELVEPKTVKGGFTDGVWWAIVTASTVGYGDIAPSTFWGRCIAVVLMLSGIGLISTFSASVTSHFVGQQEAMDMKEIRERLSRIEALLATQNDGHARK
ncbi:MAG: potassium channel family protein [Bryobacteraceae bacterium]